MKAAVLGSPISHSLSPILHLAAYRQLGLNYTYEAIDLKAENFIKFFSELDSGWLGFSLTMPLKEVAFKVATHCSTISKQTGVINTLVFKDDIYGDNTDVYGISKALRDFGCIHPSTATIIGAGATARSAIVALYGLGVQEVIVLARNPTKNANCIDLGNELGIILDATSEVSDRLFQTDVVINTTPAGVADDYVPLLNEMEFGNSFLQHSKQFLLDAAYFPWPSKLAVAWENKKQIVIPGHEMLLHQAVRQVELMTGLEPDILNMRKSLMEALEKR